MLQDKILANVLLFEKYAKILILLSQYLLVHIQQWKTQNNVGNMFKVNSTESITTVLTC